MILVGTSDLTAGNHIFDFKFILPEALPSSLEGAFGYVRYTAKVILKRKYKIDLCYQTNFTVLSHIDLNLKPRLKVGPTFYVLNIENHFISSHFSESR